MKRFAFLVMLFLFAKNTLAVGPIDFSIDTKFLEKNIKFCDESIKKHMLDGIENLKNRKVDDFTIVLAGESEAEWVQYSKNEECIDGLLDNSILILDTYIRTAPRESYCFTSSKNSLAKAIMMKSRKGDASDRKKAYEKADSLVDEYLKEEEFDPNGEIATPYYFAAYSYIDAAKLTKDINRISLLDKAIAIAKQGKSINISSSLKNELNEPIGISFGEKAKFFPKESDDYKNQVFDGLSFFEAGFKSGDFLAGYNVAVSYSLLNDSNNSKRWLEMVANKGAIDKQICLDGILRDPDLNYLRANNREWLTAFFLKNCSGFLPKGK